MTFHCTVPAVIDFVSCVVSWQQFVDSHMDRLQKKYRNSTVFNEKNVQSIKDPCVSVVPYEVFQIMHWEHVKQRALFDNILFQGKEEVLPLYKAQLDLSECVPHFWFLCYVDDTAKSRAAQPRAVFSSMPNKLMEVTLSWLAAHLIECNTVYILESLSRIRDCQKYFIIHGIYFHCRMSLYLSGSM